MVPCVIVSTPEPTTLNAELVDWSIEAVAPLIFNAPETTEFPVNVHAPPIVNAAVAVLIFPGTLVVPFKETAALLVIPVPTKVAVELVVNEPLTKLFPVRLIVTLLGKISEEWPLAPKDIPLKSSALPFIVRVTPKVLFHVTAVANTKLDIVPVDAILKIVESPPVLVTVTLGSLLVPGVKIIFPDPPSPKFVEPN